MQLPQKWLSSKAEDDYRKERKGSETDKTTKE